MGPRLRTFLRSLVVTVLEGAGPPGAPRRHLTIYGTRDLAQLGPVGDRTLAQLVLHWAGGCADERKKKQEADKINLLYFDPTLICPYVRFFTRDLKMLIYFIPGTEVPTESR